MSPLTVSAQFCLCCPPVAVDDLAATTRDGIPADEVYRLIDDEDVYQDRYHTAPDRRSARAQLYALIERPPSDFTDKEGGHSTVQ